MKRMPLWHHVTTCASAEDFQVVYVLLHWFPFIILVTKSFKSLFFLCVLETRKIKTHKNYAFLWCSLSTLKTRNSCYAADGKQPRSRICWTCRSFVARLCRGLGLSTRLDKRSWEGTDKLDDVFYQQGALQSKNSWGYSAG